MVTVWGKCSWRIWLYSLPLGMDDTILRLPCLHIVALMRDGLTNMLVEQDSTDLFLSSW